MVSIAKPDGWDLIARAGSTDAKVFEPGALPPRAQALAILNAYLEAAKFENGRINGDYLNSLGLAVPYSMIWKKPAADLIRGGSRFSEKIMLH